MFATMLSRNLPCTVATIALLSTASAPAHAEPLRVVASFSIIGDFAAKVGGDRIALTTLVGPNGDAHAYEPRPTDARALAEADVVLTNGLELEGFMDRLITASGSRAPIVPLTQGIDTLEEPGGGHYHFVNGEAIFHVGALNAHAWQSVPNAQRYIANTRDAFCAADAQGCPIYTANAASYRDALDALDRDIRAAVSALPPGRRTVVVGHSAFGYFEQAYGVTFLSPQGVSTASEASAADLAGLIEAMRKADAKAIFAENISDPRLVSQIAAEVGTQLSGTLYSDALSEPDGPAPDYIAMMRHNLNALSAALTAAD
ncbi:metal ABC transporter solute-binding protein, Zn/Mn family [Aureimonas frigidaquae]|uniref:metal ABC transporter solute-binding protein, Zn/Mn family n=1 Tax=Aureimonas frigidaquae TaxID=424757 RepID=UPI000AFAB3EE|nr:zinc ABC transporter substrate-binding protein [Aureimonas frigidaquae]